MSCKWCRFRKCVKAGMIVNWAKGEDQSVVKRQKISCTLTKQEVDQFQRLFSNLMENYHAKYYQLYSKKSDIFQGLMKFAFKTTTNVNYSLLVEVDKIDEQVAKNFAWNLPDMDKLTIFDRMSLLSYNYRLIFGLWYLAGSSYGDLQYFFKNFVQYGQERKGQEDIDNVLEKLEAMTLDEIPTKYADEIMPITPIEHLQNQWHALAKKTRARLLDSETGHLNTVLFTLLMLIVIYFPERVNLENKEKVVEIYEKHVWLLDRYLRTKFGREKAVSMLHQMLMIISYAESLYDIFAKAHL